MGRRPSSALIGAFVAGAVVLAVAAAIVLGGDRFFSRRTTYVAYFDGALDGLDVGAPVTFNGVRIGSVKDVRVDVDPEGASIRTPVLFDIDARRLHHARRGATLDAVIQRGLRARLEMQSLLTGQRAVALNFYPDTPARFVGSKRYPEVPTIPSRIDTLTRTLQNLPLDTLVAESVQAMRSIRTLAGSPELRAAFGKLDRVLTDVDGLVQTVNRRVDPLATSVEQTTVAARTTMADASAALAQITHAADAALADYRALARDARREVAHAGEEIGLLVGSVRTTLTDAQAVLAETRGVVGADSPVREDLTNALHEITKAARAVRTLADYLERHPEAVLVGKSPEARP